MDHKASYCLFDGNKSGRTCQIILYGSFGSLGFDFAGTYTLIRPHQLLAFTLDDGRKVEVQFNELEDGTEIIENFEADDQYSIEEQKKGWQAILENFNVIPKEVSHF
jgi:hypothetical protein